jgi:hypothetical protein
MFFSNPVKREHSIRSFNFKTKTVIEIDKTAVKNTMNIGWIKNWNNIVVAGGHVSNAVMNDTFHMDRGDIDIFFVFSENFDGAGVDRIMKEKIIDINNWLIESFPEHRIFLNRSTAGNIDIKLVDAQKSTIKVQIIVKMWFRSIDSVLDSFDLNVVKFAWSENELYYTPDAKQYLETKVVKAIQEHQSPWLKFRTEKYKRPYNTIQWISINSLDHHQRKKSNMRYKWFTQNYRPKSKAPPSLGEFGLFTLFEILKFVNGGVCFDDFEQQHNNSLSQMTHEKATEWEHEKLDIFNHVSENDLPPVQRDTPKKRKTSESSTSLCNKKSKHSM